MFCSSLLSVDPTAPLVTLTSMQLAATRRTEPPASLLGRTGAGLGGLHSYKFWALMSLWYHAEHHLEAEQEKQTHAVPQPICPARAATAPASHPSTPSQLAKQAERAQALHKAAQIIQSRGGDLPSPDHGHTSGMSMRHLLSCTYLPLKIES